MDKLKELATAKANFISEMEEYKKNYRELLYELLEKYNLHKDCEYNGRVGIFRVIEDRYSNIRPYEVRFFPYTRNGELSLKSSDCLIISENKNDEMFEKYIEKVGIKTIEGQRSENG
ncbi:MAG: hypothetical protein J6A75_13480 [Lachnospiraceae bacterium]|nr:hypothetical protein [Lachnospiraceae bacterium]